MMTATPHQLETARLRLRRFVHSDAPDIQRLAGDRLVAATTQRIPHPYPEGAAEAWIASLTLRENEECSRCFAMTLHQDESLIGSIGLTIDWTNHRAELGYWVGRPFWGNGYCTEAGQAVLRFAFASLKLNRVYAHCYSNNPASARVLEKLGMQYEGCCRQHICKWNEFLDMQMYGLLRGQWEVAQGQTR